MVMKPRLTFGEFESRLSFYANALGHPSRVAIILEIFRNNNLIEGDNLHVEGMTRMQIEKHVSELQRAGYITGRVLGLKRSYSVNRETISDLFALFLKFSSQIKSATEFKNDQ
jgi:hypothetical protein